MMLRWVCLSWALLAGLWQPAVAAESDAGAVAQLRSFLSVTQAAHGEFTQRVRTAGGGGEQVSSGSFVFQRPGRLRWVYRAPYEQVLVSNGQTLYLYDRDLNQVTIKKMAGALPASPAAILFGSNAFEDHFGVQDLGQRDGLAWLQATPKAEDSSFERIEIGFKNRLPVQMKLMDHFGQQTLLMFSKFQRQAVVSDALFDFQIPDGADVLEDGQTDLAN